ncbi:MAG: hypothetical protein NZX77_23060, partial [Polyangiaceae bacterium]|nr:hypothetical protein [Polyangiaceae bacterium]
MKREKRLTKRERKALAQQGEPSRHHKHTHEHLHCIACGRHLDPEEFDEPASATFITCAHKSEFPSCVGCKTDAQRLVDEHDRSGEPVKAKAAW